MFGYLPVEKRSRVGGGGERGLSLPKHGEGGKESRKEWD